MAKIAFDPESVDFSLPMRDQPRYSVGDASAYLGISASTIRSWFFGTTYGRSGEKTPFEPVLLAACERSKLLSFDNLVEAYVLRRFRIDDGIQLRDIGKAIETAKESHGIQKPLLEENLIKVGKSIFLEIAGKCVGLTDPGQLLMDNAGAFFERIAYKDDAITAIYPKTRPELEHSPKIISISPDYAFGRSVIDSNKVATSVIHERYLNGDSVSDLAAEYACEITEIEEANRAEWTFLSGKRSAA